MSRVPTTVWPADPGAVGWDHPRTARAYEEFCERHDRYRVANTALVGQAALAAGQRVLDLAAGTGRTAEAALPWLGAAGRVVCVEPAAAMRVAGQARLQDPRLAWTAAWPRERAAFDRVLCGAAMWQLQPLASTFRLSARLLRPGGALCFNVPSLYLGEPDEPGGGRDPLLFELPARLAAGRPPPATAALPLPSAAGMEEMLAAVGLRPECWSFRVRLTQEAYRDWLRIPVLTDSWLAGLDPEERDYRLEEVFAWTDPSSWRWERWTGWTAWKPAV